MSTMRLNSIYFGLQIAISSNKTTESLGLSSSKVFARENLYDATFRPKRMIDRHDVSKDGSLYLKFIWK